MRNTSFELTLYGCVISICCVGFAFLDVVCDELYGCGDLRKEPARWRYLL